MIARDLFPERSCASYDEEEPRIDVPTITGLTPTSGPTSGGTAVTITGTNLTSTSQVTFNSVPAPFSVINATTVSAVTPPGTLGAVDVGLSNPAGTATDVGAFTYVAGPGI
ncbi:IPT/TIG domain-containing protein [Streptomyces sp. NPDC002540]